MRRPCAQGEVWWANLPTPAGSEPGFRRPLVIVQSDPFNRCGLRTVVCASISSNPDLMASEGNVAIKAGESGLPRDSLVNVTQLVTVDVAWLDRRAGALPGWVLTRVLDGVALVLGIE